MDTLSKMMRDIKIIKVQGARTVAMTGLRVFRIGIKRIKAEDRKEFLNESFVIAKKLAGIRATEPALRNSLAYMLYKIKTSPIENVNKLKKIADEQCKAYESELKRIHEDIAEIAAKSIDGTIMTHCHSATVVSAIKRAWDMKKKIRVICTETRPLYQGVKTAKELSEYGIPTTLIIDSAIRMFMKDVDIVVLGADAICANGAVINKIGSGLLAAIAKEQRKTVIVIAGSYKFDPMTMEGYPEPIEERDPREIIDPRKLPKVKIRNPAFDVIPSDYISMMVTDFGVHPATDAYSIFLKKFKWFEKDHSILKQLM
jgi:ribose 1,5-bisphosphate isomerase